MRSSWNGLHELYWFRANCADATDLLDYEERFLRHDGKKQLTIVRTRCCFLISSAENLQNHWHVVNNCIYMSRRTTQRSIPKHGTGYVCICDERDVGTYRSDFDTPLRNEVFHLWCKHPNLHG